MNFVCGVRNPQSAIRHLLLIVLLLFPAFAWAGTGDVVSSPMLGVKPRSKLSMTLDPVWVEGNGYRPVRIKLTNSPATPALADRNFTIEIAPRNYYSSQDVIKVEGDLTIPQGKASAETTISVPYSGQWNMITVEVYEDGSRLRDMKLETAFNSPMAGQGIDTLPSFLVIDRNAPTRDQRALLKRMNFNLGPGGSRAVATYDLPDLRGLAALNPYSNAYFSGNQAEDMLLLQSLFSMPTLELLPPRDLPEKWIDYSCFDVVIVTAAELKSMQTGEPRRFGAVRDWAAAGGTLVVSGLGAEFERLNEVEQALAMPRVDPKSKWGPAREWLEPKRGTYNPHFHLYDDGNQYNQYNRRIIMPGTGAAIQAGSGLPPGMMVDQNGNVVPDPSYRPNAVIAELPSLRIRPLQMGRVVAVSSDNLFPSIKNQKDWEQQNANWLWINQNIGKTNLTWYQRHGVSLVADNHDYWNFLIPGVGMAPVTGFRILISLFVILIGPVNYLLLRRWKRLYLLLVTVPVGAAAVTLCLLGYALVTDGLGVRARVRSFTHLDQKSGAAVSWSRQSYYAGLAPSRGMMYPEDTAVYRIIDNRFDSGPASKNLIWNDREQNLRSGFLNSRITAQFLVVRSDEKTPARVEVQETPGGQKPPQIENRLGTKIQAFALCDSQGTWYWTGELAAGKSVVLEERPSSESFGVLRQLAAANPLLEPPGFNANSHDYFGPTRFGRRRYNYAYYNRGTSTPPTMNSSLLEAELRMATAGGAAPLAPRSYVAIVDRSPQVPLGVESAREESSLHVVVGQW